MACCKKLRLGNILTFFLDVALFVLLLLQVYIGGCFIILGYLPLPSGWCERVITQEYSQDIIIKIDEAKLFPGGDIGLSGVDVKADSIIQSLIRADSIDVSLDWKYVSGLPRVKDLLISSGTVFIPSVYSPDGFQKALLERMTLRISLNEISGGLNQLVALHDNIRLRGIFETPAQIRSKSNYNFSQNLKSFYAQAANIIQKKEQFDYFDSPTITFNINRVNHEKKEIDLHITSRDLKHPEIFAKNIEFLGSVEFIGLEPKLIKEAHLKAQYLDVPSLSLMAEDLFAMVGPRQLKMHKIEDWPKIKLAAKSIAFNKLSSNTPTLEIELNKYPRVAFCGTTGSLNGAAALNGYINTQNKSGKLYANGSFDLIELATEKVREKLPEFIFEAPPFYQVELDLDPNFALRKAQIKANINKFHVKEIAFDHVTASTNFKDGVYVISDTHIRRNKQEIELDFIFDSRSYNYRASIIGSIIPKDYNTLLPRWWASVFKDFDFRENQHAVGDFNIYGNTRSKLSNLYYGRAQAHNISYKDVAVDEGDSIVRGRNNYTELKGLHVTCGSGWVSGDIAFMSESDEIQAPLSVHFDMQAKIGLDDAAKLTKKNIAQVISYFKTKEPTLFHIKGAIFNREYSAYAGKSFFDLSANCEKAITFKNIPLSRLSFDLHSRTNGNYLRDLKLIYAEGEGFGELDILKDTTQGNTLRYRFSLKDANQKKAQLGLSEIENIGTKFKVSTGNNKSNLSSGRINMTLHGEGALKDPMKHTGYGSFIINNNQLGSFQLLGPLSRILQKTPLDFTTFNLNRMHGNFHYKNEDVHFDPLQLDGALALISPLVDYA